MPVLPQNQEMAKANQHVPSRLRIMNADIVICLLPTESGQNFPTLSRKRVDAATDQVVILEFHLSKAIGFQRATWMS